MVRFGQMFLHYIVHKSLEKKFDLYIILSYCQYKMNNNQMSITDLNSISG